VHLLTAVGAAILTTLAAAVEATGVQVDLEATVLKEVRAMPQFRSIIAELEVVLSLRIIQHSEYSWEAEVALDILIIQKDLKQMAEQVVA
jgi:hypothetical protein